MSQSVDFHVHPASAETRRGREEYLVAASRLFQKAAGPVIIPIEETAQNYRDLDMRAVLLALDAETATGFPPVGNDYVAECVRRFPDVFLGFGSVDPWKGKLAVREVKRCANELGLRGIKLMPATQAFFLNDRQFYPIYEACAEHGLLLLVHMGTTGIGAGNPGGDGIHLKYCRPIPCLDDVAADFPELTIIGAHPGWPWHDELLATCVHKANVYMDLSGWSPKYLPESVVRYANSLLQDKCLFGSDYPFIRAERWLQDFEQVPLKPEVRRKILFDNARRLLNL